MLLDFTFKNVRSFKDETTFSMDSGEGLTRLQRTNTLRKYIKQKQSIRILKSAFVLGGNATGKSNLLKALLLLRKLVILGTDSELDMLPTDTYASNQDNTLFTIRFFKNDKLFEYHIEYNENKVMKESLCVNEISVFERTNMDVKVPILLEGLKHSLRQNQPLLFFAQNNNVLEAKEAYEWFALDIVSPSLYGNTSLDQQIFKPLLNDTELKDRVLYFLKAADFNIIDIQVTERFYADEDSLINKGKRIQVEFKHEGTDRQTFTLNWTAESVGTRIFIMLAMHILQHSNQNAVFIIDEFDRSLHPKLVTMLVRLFNEWNGHSQFIATTHNNEILNNTLRRDQIWFVDKNYQGVSDLYSAFDFDEQPTMNQLKKNYQNGQYGADQIINEDMLVEILRS